MQPERHEPAIDAALAQFRARPPGRPAPAWLADARAAASQRLAGSVLPSERSEAWRYTNLPGLSDAAALCAVTADASNAPAVPIGWLDALGPLTKYCIVDGVLPPGLAATDRAPVAFGSFADAAGTDALTDFNTLFTPTVAHIDIHPGQPAPPLLLQTYSRASTRGQVTVRICVTLHADAQLDLIELLDADGGVHNVMVEIALGERAHLRHYRASRAGAATQIARASVQVGAGACYEHFTLASGGGRCRDELHVDLAGASARAELAAVAQVHGRDHADLAWHVRHRANDTRSVCTVRGVAGGRGRFVFRGAIDIPAGVRGIDAALGNKNLLLSNDAEVDTRPELTINADDVRCSHGATVGQLDADALFLLRSRGIDEAHARALVLRAFVAAAPAALPASPLRDIFSARLAALSGEAAS